MRSYLQTGASPRGWERCIDIAVRWLTRCSNGSCQYLISALNESSDEELADKCICCWGLDQPQGDDNDITWFEQHETDRRMLVEAFAATRAYFAEEL
ncbi:hypothetical protein [Methylocystis sp. ATCC 49242]|uniref:hypothetical protein n=1 Tax=Methylocystis sp. ATCC 49242 TaxID=622637 RepID=UPI0001F86F7A|nr:hypothetical protein [Methylocystis sp. ATCC 49242]